MSFLEILPLSLVYLLCNIHRSRVNYILYIVILKTKFMIIQINSLEALEKLIGDDKTLEIQLSKAVIKEFSEKHFEDLVTKLVNDYLDIEFGKRNTYAWAKLPDDFKRRADDVVIGAISSFVKDQIKKKVSRVYIKSVVENRLESTIEDITRSIDKEAIKQRAIDHVLKKLNQS